MGRVKTSEQRTDGTTYPFEYSYNLAGALIEETYPSTRVVKYTLNADGELAQVQSKKNSNSGYWKYADAFSYNAAGAVTKMQLGNGRWETAEYNDRQQLTMIGLGATGGVQDLLKLEFRYGVWDGSTLDESKNNGSMAEQKIIVPAVGSNPTFTAVQKYTYDSLNRIHDATETVSSTQTWKQTFSYDRYGNRRFDTTNNNTTTIPAGCSAAVCNPDIDTSNNRLSSSQGYDYDQNGALVEDALGQRFGYDAESHQKEFFDASNSGSTPDATYHYDGEGRRVKKVVGTEVTIFVYDAAGQLASEYSTTIASTQDAQVSYLTADHLGSPRIITDENGAVTNRKDFTAFGETVTSSQRVAGPGGNNYDDPQSVIRQDYTGYQKDGESGLEFAQARYYNPEHGRFTSVDPLTASATIRNPQTFNRYSYVLNSPYKFIDPLGLIAGGCGADRSDCQGSGGIGSSNIAEAEAEWSSRQVTITERVTRYVIIQQETNANGVVTHEATITVTRRQRTTRSNLSGVTITEDPTYHSTAVDSGVGNYSPDQKTTMAQVAKDIVRVGHEKKRDVVLFLAMAREETVMGIGQKLGDPNNKGRPEMDPVTNPLQLDGDANKKYYAKIGDVDHNLTYSMKHFDEEWKKATTLQRKLEHYNDGGIIGSKGRNYANRVMTYMKNIRVTNDTYSLRIGR